MENETIDDLPGRVYVILCCDKERSPASACLWTGSAGAPLAFVDRDRGADYVVKLAFEHPDSFFRLVELP